VSKAQDLKIWSIAIQGLGHEKDPILANVRRRSICPSIFLFVTYFATVASELKFGSQVRWCVKLRFKDLWHSNPRWKGPYPNLRVSPVHLSVCRPSICLSVCAARELKFGSQIHWCMKLRIKRFGHYKDPILLTVCRPSICPFICSSFYMSVTYCSVATATRELKFGSQVRWCVKFKLKDLWYSSPESWVWQEPYTS